MSATFDDYPLRRRDGVTIPTIAIWVVVSLLLHVALLLLMPLLQKPTDQRPEQPPLTAYLRPGPVQEARSRAPELPQPDPKPAPAPKARAAPPKMAVKPKALPTEQAPVIALAKPVTPEPKFTIPARKPERPAPPSVAAPAPPTVDFAAAIEAKRQARGEISPETAAAAEVGQTTQGALNSTALKATAPPALVTQRERNGYGSFDIRSRGFDHAEFMFRGWNENFRRDGLELIVVRKGNHADIDIAVIRSMIEIIRRTERGNFPWYSYRIGRTVILSARAIDNSGLEDFLMKEFYDDLHRYYGR